MAAVMEQGRIELSNATITKRIEFTKAKESFEKARDRFEQALKIAESLEQSGRGDRAKTYMNLANCMFGLYGVAVGMETDDAKSYLTKAIDYREKACEESKQASRRFRIGNT